MCSGPMVGSIASSRFQVGAGEALTMVMVMIWWALVLWWGSEARWTLVFMNDTACIMSQLLSTFTYMIVYVVYCSWCWWLVVNLYMLMWRVWDYMVVDYVMNVPLFCMLFTLVFLIMFILVYSFLPFSLSCCLPWTSCRYSRVEFIVISGS